jgi:alpha-galactosidase
MGFYRPFPKGGFQMKPDSRLAGVVLLLAAVCGVEVIAEVAAMSELALTPPMGFNTWNAFQADIDEQMVKDIADAMVASGMRDAGYEYLVLDDGWMADKRDEEGNLAADPNKFPSGMKAIGDYIHSKGLKFGIYEDRGKWTCQQLPGSFRHEQADMNSFAEWGVDYIKLDSCFAENNGRLSTDDYALYRECIEKTGRPMVLSISDFGNGAWAWDGKDMAQLWRTSNDIYPWMGSVYHCAETSAGDQAIHPDFNGLWQFAGPGHWNDPDMLQVGNLKKETEDRAHFSLWCILAAPLMAGNDLRTMSESVRKTLTAPELIAVNQDPRGIQGYKVYDGGDCEIYNKQLCDGRTAVLLLNKGEREADITVNWEMIGLAGRQKVRDLWARKDLGEYADSFTARGLGQHGHVMLKVGSEGTPLPSPKPLPPEKYMVTRPGRTYLSDLCYIWKNGNAPKADTNYSDKSISIGGKTYKKGLGCKGGSRVIYKLNNRAERFQAVVGLDDSYDGDGEGRFRLYDEDFFGNRVLYDSGKMKKDSPAKVIDIDVKEVKCLMLVFEGEDVLGNWADAAAVAQGPAVLEADSIERFNADGEKFERGKRFSVLVDGEVVNRRDSLRDK